MHVPLVNLCFVFTGCDSVSSFYGKGKRKAWKTAMETDSQETFKTLGNEVSPTEMLCEALSRYVCALYGHECDSVNEVRCIMFRLGSFSDESLPPTHDCLTKHIERANYQAFLWKRCLIPLMVPPSPLENGWILSQGKLSINWMESNIAPDQLLEHINCGCKAGCSTQRCSCVKAGLPCTDLCKCINCNNNSDGTSDDEELLPEYSGENDEQIDS